jgi:DNA-binding PadR family transcriptional regulator
MDVRKLVILGLLRTGSQHGYQLNQSIADNYRFVTDMSPAVTYKFLEKLAESGDVSLLSEQGDIGPVRRIYAITSQGEQTFMALLREHLAVTPPMVFAGATGLLFIDALERGEAATLLQRRLGMYRLQHEQVTAQHAQQSFSPSLARDLAFDYQLALFRAVEEWLVTAVRRLEQTTD